MRIKLLAAVILLGTNASAQNYTANNIIEGGKTLVELVRIFKIPKNSLAQQNIIDNIETKRNGDNLRIKSKNNFRCATITQLAESEITNVTFASISSVMFVKLPTSLLFVMIGPLPSMLLKQP